MTWVIETGIPVPEIINKPTAKKTGLTKALREMERGQSMAIPDGKHPDLTGRVANIYKNTGREFVIRSIPEGLRIWRVK